MSNKLNSFYLTLLIVLTGALILGSGVTAFAATDGSVSDTDTGGVDVYRGERHMIQEVNIADSGGDTDSLDISHIDIEKSTGTLTKDDFDTMTLYQEDGTNVGFQPDEDTTPLGTTQDVGSFPVTFGTDDSNVFFSVANDSSETVYVVATMASDASADGNDIKTNFNASDAIETPSTYSSGDGKDVATSFATLTSAKVSTYADNTPDSYAIWKGKQAQAVVQRVNLQNNGVDTDVNFFKARITSDVDIVNGDFDKISVWMDANGDDKWDSTDDTRLDKQGTVEFGANAVIKVGNDADTILSLDSNQSETLFLVMTANATFDNFVTGDSFTTSLQGFTGTGAQASIDSKEWATYATDVSMDTVQISDDTGGTTSFGTALGSVASDGTFVIEYNDNGDGVDQYNTDPDAVNAMDIKLELKGGDDTGYFRTDPISVDSSKLSDTVPGIELSVTDSDENNATDNSFVRSKISFGSSSYELDEPMTITVENEQLNTDNTSSDDGQTLNQIFWYYGGSEEDASGLDTSFNEVDSDGVSATDSYIFQATTLQPNNTNVNGGDGFDAGDDMDLYYQDDDDTTTADTGTDVDSDDTDEIFASATAGAVTVSTSTDFDQSSYAQDPSETATVEVTDSSKNTDAGSPNTISGTDVLVVKSLDEDGIEVDSVSFDSITESGDDTDIFDKDVHFGANIGELKVDTAVQITATYTDPADSSRTSSDTVPVGSTVSLYDSNDNLKWEGNSIDTADSEGAYAKIVVEDSYDFRDESGKIDIATSGITIEAADDGDDVMPVVNTRDVADTAFQIGNSGVKIDGLKVKNGGTTYDILIDVDSGSFDLYNSVLDLTGNSYNDIGVDVADVTAELNNTEIKVDAGDSSTDDITSNFAPYNSDVGVKKTTGGSDNTLTVTDSTFTGSGGIGIGDATSDLDAEISGTTFDGTELGLVLSNASSDVEIYNTTFKDGSWDSTNDEGAAIVAKDLTATAVVYNTTIKNNAGYSVNIPDETNVTLKFNNIWGNTEGMAGGGTIDITAKQNWWGDTDPSDQIGAGATVTYTPYLKAAVDAADYSVTSTTSLNPEDTVGAYVDGGGTIKGLVKYSSSPEDTKDYALNYFRVEDVDTADNNTIRFYTESSATAYFWNGAQWIEATSQAYSSSNGYVQVNLTGSTTPTKSELNTFLDFVIAGVPAGTARDMNVVQGWQMIGLGFEPADTTPSAVFGENLGAVFEWDPSINEYVNAGEATSVEPEIGYWFYSSSGTSENPATLELGYGTNIESDYEIVFENTGWMMFSVPFDTFWNNVRFGDSLETGVKPKDAAALTADKVYTYKLDIEGYGKAVAGLDEYGDDVGLLKADKAYWVEIAMDYATPVKMQVPFNPSPTPTSMATAAAADISHLEAGTSTPPAPPAAPQAVAGELKATAAMNNGSVTFQVTGADVQSINVQVFAANGEEIFSDSAQGSSLSWNAEVANGLYLYGVSAKVNGTVKPLGIQKLLVLQ